MSTRAKVVMGLTLVGVLIFGGADVALFWALMFGIVWSPAIARRLFRKISQRAGSPNGR